MVSTKASEVGESSTSAAKKALKANTNGVTNYELPWYVLEILIVQRRG